MDPTSPLDACILPCGTGLGCSAPELARHGSIHFLSLMRHNIHFGHGHDVRCSLRRMCDARCSSRLSPAGERSMVVGPFSSRGSAADGPIRGVCRVVLLEAQPARRAHALTARTPNFGSHAFTACMVSAESRLTGTFSRPDAFPLHRITRPDIPDAKTAIAQT